MPEYNYIENYSNYITTLFVQFCACITFVKITAYTFLVLCLNSQRGHHNRISLRHQLTNIYMSILFIELLKNLSDLNEAAYKLKSLLYCIFGRRPQNNKASFLRLTKVS
jgi:hypothetical protein